MKAKEFKNRSRQSNRKMQGRMQKKVQKIQKHQFNSNLRKTKTNQLSGNFNK